MTAMGMANRRGSHAPQSNTGAAASGWPCLSLPPSAAASCEELLVVLDGVESWAAWQQWEHHPSPAFGPFEPPIHPRLLTSVRIAQAD